MIAATSPALEDALAALRAPGLLPRLRERALPEGQGLLLRIVAGDAEARREGARLGNADEDAVREAAMLYVQQVLFHASADSYRVLGARQGASPETLKQHHRWLLHWLHPDRQADAWEAVYAERVNRAWQDLRTEERRVEYARRREALAAAAPVAASPRRIQPTPMRRPPRDEPTVLSSRTVRRLPALILGALAVGAIALLSLMALVSGPVAGPADAPRVARDEAPPRALPDARARSVPAPRTGIVATPRTATAARNALVPPIGAPATASLDAALDAALLREIAMERRLSQPAVAQAAPRVEVAAAMTDSARAPPAAPADAPQPVAAATTAAIAAPAASTQEQAVTRVAPVVAPVPESPTPAAAAAPAMPVVASAATTTAAAPARASEAAASPAANDLIARFREAYASGDIARLRALLAAPAHADPREQAALLRDYESFFRRSATRSIELRTPSWTAQGDRTVLTARYETSFLPRDATRLRRDRGDIRFVLRREGGEWRIVTLTHASGRGG